jgi:hypothetical protein
VLHGGLAGTAKARHVTLEAPGGPGAQTPCATGAAGSEAKEAQDRGPREPPGPRQDLWVYRRVHGATLMVLHDQLYSIEGLVLTLLLAITYHVPPTLPANRTEQSNDPLARDPD